MENQKYHENWMRSAIEIAKKGVGLTAENPSVGCIIIDNSGDKPLLLARARTANGGRPHAEITALEMAGSNAKGADLYVSLEPCCHIGRTKPCTDAIIKAGISRVFIAIIDPYEKVEGLGIEKLGAAGIEVYSGICEKQANDVNIGFFTRVNKLRPYISLKMALSSNDKIAGKNNNPVIITNEQSHRMSHMMRAKSDAIMVGSNTVSSDNPALTCRLADMTEQSPIKVILDSKLRISESSNLVKTTYISPLWIITNSYYWDDKNSFIAKKHKIEGLTRNIKVIDLADEEYNEYSNFMVSNKSHDNLLDLELLMRILAANGVGRLLVEGGAKLASSLMKFNLIDEIHLFKSNTCFIDDGIDALCYMGINEIIKSTKFIKQSESIIENDNYSIFKKA